MPRKPKLALPLLLLASTTLAIGSIVYGLLWKESERLRQSTLATANEQASTVAENVGLTIAEIKTALMQSLLDLDGPDFSPQLEAWQAQDPLVDFAFLWRNDNPTTATLFPHQKTQATDLLSILKLPSGKREISAWLWDERPSINPYQKESQERYSLASSDIAPTSNYAENTKLRQSIRSQSQEANRVAQSFSKARRKRWTSNSTEWILQREGSSDYWIGISRWNDGEAITGAAIKLDALGALLEKSFPAQFTSNVIQFEIRDASGKTITKAGPINSYVRSYKSPLSGFSQQFPIGSELPGWTLTMRTNLEGSMTDILTSSAGISTTFILLALFTTGLWLVWQSRASQIDAARKVSFVSNVSHELKTPLTTIRMYSELLQSGRVSLQEKRANYLQTISSEAQRLTRLVNNVLDFNRLESGKAKLACQSQALTPVVESYLEMRAADLQQAQFELDLQIETSDILATYDSDALCQILGNLIDNSLKYAQAGRFLRIRISKPNQRPTIELADKGPGLPEQLRSTHFKAFQRGDDSLVSESSGFGLGLNIAQTLADEMGATLRYHHPHAKQKLPTFKLTLQP